jgi:hypothetical protein
VDGVPDEYLAASAKSLGAAERAAFERHVRSVYWQMVRIAVEPRRARFYDFGAGRIPAFLARLGNGGQPGAARPVSRGGAPSAAVPARAGDPRLNAVRLPKSRCAAEPPSPAAALARRPAPDAEGWTAPHGHGRHVLPNRPRYRTGPAVSWRVLVIGVPQPHRALGNFLGPAGVRLAVGRDSNACPHALPWPGRRPGG